MAFISVDYHKIPISKMRLRLVCWDNFSLSHEIIHLFRSDNSFVCVIAGNWYLLSQSLILLATLSTQGEQGTLPMCLLWPHHGGGQCSKKNCCMKSQSHERLWPPLLKLKFENDWLPSNYCGSSCKKINSGFQFQFQFQGFQFQFHFQFHQFQFQFQFRNWNWNWAAIPIPELNWPQPWPPVYQIWRIYLDLWGHDCKKWVWPTFSCKLGQNDPIVMQLKLDMSCHLLNVYTKFQIDISKHVEEKSGKRGRTDGRTGGRTDIATA